MSTRWSKLEARDRRALLLCALIVLPSLLAARLVPAAREWEAANAAQIADQHREVDRSLRLLESIESIVKPDPSKPADDARRYFAAARLPEAIADATEYLDGIARVAGVEVVSLGISGDTAFDAGAAIVKLRVSVTAGTGALFTLVRELELGPRSLPIRSVTISQRGLGAQGAEYDRVSAEMLIEAYAVARGQGR